MSQQQKAQPQAESLLGALEVQIVLHLEYHSYDVPRRKVRQLLETCEPLFSRDTDDKGLGIKRTIIAYSRPRNRRDLLQKAKLYQKRGKEEVSTDFQELGQCYRTLAPFLTADISLLPGFYQEIYPYKIYDFTPLQTITNSSPSCQFHCFQQQDLPPQYRN